MAVNNSVLTGLDFTIGSPAAFAAGSTSVIQLGIQMEDVDGGSSFSTHSQGAAFTSDVNVVNSTLISKINTITNVTLSAGALPSSMASSTFRFYYMENSGEYWLLNDSGTMLAASLQHTRDDATDSVSMEFAYGGETFTLTAKTSYNVTGQTLT